MNQSTVLDVQSKVCTKCKEEKPLTEYSKAKSNRLGVQSYCKVCQKAHGRKYKSSPSYKVRRKHQDLVRRYGLTLNEYEARLEAQGYKCVTCNEDLGDNPNHIHVDHCHSTGKVRGILCTHCNRALGAVKDNPGTLKNLQLYLLLNESLSKTT